MKNTLLQTKLYNDLGYGEFTSTQCTLSPCLHHQARIAAGHLHALIFSGTEGGERLFVRCSHSSRWTRIFRISSAWTVKLMILISVRHKAAQAGERINLPELKEEREYHVAMEKVMEGISPMDSC